MPTNATLPLKLYGWAILNSDGTAAAKSPNVTTSRSGLGEYLVQPAQHFGPNQMVADVTSLNSVPLAMSTNFGSGPTTDAWLFTTYLPSTLAPLDAAVFVRLYTIGETDYSVVP